MNEAPGSREGGSATHRYAIVLAAGAGRRYGGGKMSAVWRDRPLVEWAVAAALACRVDGVVVVVGCDHGPVSDAVNAMDDPRIEIVLAADWREGISASLKAGLRTLPSTARSAAIFLGDMPLIESAEVERLFLAVERGAPTARFVHSRGPAHPVVFSQAAFEDLVALSGDEGGRSVVTRLGGAAFLTDCYGAIFDIDEPPAANLWASPK